METEKFSKIVNYAVPLVTMAGLYIVGKGAFSRGVRRQILRRDGGCVADGKHGGKLEASHRNHSRERIVINGVETSYNDPRRGETLCTKHHLYFHQDHLGPEIGLTDSQNDWAIERLEERCLEMGIDIEEP